MNWHSLIKTKSIYALKDKSDGIRILITRYWPHGIKKENFNKWYKDLSPSKELLRDYKEHKIEFQVFEKLFREEITRKKHVNDICRSIAKEASEGKEITLLCYEKEESNCHRKIIRQICEREFKLLNKHKNKI